MKSKTFLLRICAASLVALSLAGCSDYDNGYTEQQISFIKNFKEIYGEVDPTQDWNLAERGTVTVTTSQPSNIKIYAKTNGKYKIVGDYQDISGTRTLGFDVVEGTTDIMVSDGQTAQKTTVGSNVSFGFTRAIHESNITEKVGYKVIDKETYSAWRKYIPEGKFNLGKVTQDFVYVSTGDFILYPVYWRSSRTNELGIYYKGNDGKLVYHPIYTTKSSGHSYDNEAELQYKDEPDGKWINAIDTDERPYKIEFDDDDNLTEGPFEIQAEGIKVKLKEGTVFGIYVDAGYGNGHKFYSNSDRNTDIGVSYDVDTNGKVIESTIKNDFTQKAIHAATFIDNDHMYIGFEDWHNGEITVGNTTRVSDFDLNDCLFMFGEDVPEIVEEGVMPWIISAEDLGNTLDIDYNDVVIEVEHVSGRDYAYVTPLAAGGTLASYVYFDGEPVGKGIKGSFDEMKTGEIHQLFSHKYTMDAEAISGKYEPINVKSGTTPDVYSKRTYTIKIKDPDGFSLATYVPDDENHVTDYTNMGGFQIWVLKENEKANSLTEADIENMKTNGRIQKIQNVLAKGEGATEENVPYVICTPKYWTRPEGDGFISAHYRWPQESKPMLDMNGNAGAYSTPGHSFKGWVTSKESDTDWYKYPNIDITCAPTGIGVIPSLDPTDDEKYEPGTKFPKAGTYVIHTSYKKTATEEESDYILRYYDTNTSNTSVYIEEASDNNQTPWTIEYVVIDDTYYFTIHNSEGKYLCANSDGFSFDLSDKPSDDNIEDRYLFIFSPLGDTYVISNKTTSETGNLGTNTFPNIYHAQGATATFYWTFENAETNEGGDTDPDDEEETNPVLKWDDGTTSKTISLAVEESMFVIYKNADNITINGESGDYEDEYVKVTKKDDYSLEVYGKAACSNKAITISDSEDNSITLTVNVTETKEDEFGRILTPAETPKEGTNGIDTYQKSHILIATSDLPKSGNVTITVVINTQWGGGDIYGHIWNKDDNKWNSTKFTAEDSDYAGKIKTTGNIEGSYTIIELTDDVANLHEYTYLNFTSYAEIDRVCIKTNGTSAKKRIIRR